MTPAQLLRAHVAALYTFSERGRLLRVNEPQAAPAPRFFLGRTSEGKEWWVRDDLPDSATPEIARACEALPGAMDTEAAGTAMPAIERILSALAPIERTESGPAFVAPDAVPPSRAVLVTAENVGVLRAHMSAWLGDVETCAPLVAVLVDGEAVTVCGSVRRTPVAHEAGVDTAAAFRRRGHGADAVSGWVAAVSRLGVAPLYSTAWTNLASRALARRLGFRQFAGDIHIT